MDSPTLLDNKPSHFHGKSQLNEVGYIHKSFAYKYGGVNFVATETESSQNLCSKVSKVRWINEMRA
jgi:hypothetical protein